MDSNPGLEILTVLPQDSLGIQEDHHCRRLLPQACDDVTSKMSMMILLW